MMSFQCFIKEGIPCYIYKWNTKSDKHESGKTYLFYCTFTQNAALPAGLYLRNLFLILKLCFCLKWSHKSNAEMKYTVTTEANNEIFAPWSFQIKALLCGSKVENSLGKPCGKFRLPFSCGRDK